MVHYQSHVVQAVSEETKAWIATQMMEVCCFWTMPLSSSSWKIGKTLRPVETQQHQQEIIPDPEWRAARESTKNSIPTWRNILLVLCR
jgi:hypothetical protein